jgi:hypothetical protein
LIGAVYAGSGELEDALSGTDLRVDIRAPRIVTDNMYWPPTNETALRVREAIETAGTASFEDIEGRNLLRAWAFKSA